MGEIQCLMFKGAPLDDGLRTALYLTACSLIHSGERYAKFTDENGQGGVSTEHRRRVVTSALSGIEFTSIVDWKNKTTTCKFLVRDVGMPTEDEIFEGNFRWVPVYRPANDEDGDWWKN